MSQLLNEAHQLPLWKQEVRRRVAAHRTRKHVATAEPELPAQVQHNAASRSAVALARVAARYANVPSYSELSETRQRVELRAAEKATQSALETLAAVKSIVVELEPATVESAAESRMPVESAAEWEWETAAQPSVESGSESAVPDPFWTDDAIETIDANETAETGRSLERPSYGIRWAADLPERPVEPALARATHGRGVFEKRVEDWWKPASPVQDAPAAEAIEIVEPDLPIHGNLIEFPRELVATRKVRPRLADGPYAKGDEAGAQLSIFEVDPGTISIQPETAEAVHELAPPAWPAPEWSSIQLDAQTAEELVREAAEAIPVAALRLAPMNRRLMAAVVDGSLIGGVLLATAMWTLSKASTLPGLHAIELNAALALAAIGVVYQTLFSALAISTPGMKYAGVSLCTFDNQIPTRAQRLSRCGALLLSLLPVGLGSAWAIFDEEHLSWHDRLSRTYLRRN